MSNRSFDVFVRPPANPGGSATAVLLDTSADPATGVTLSRRGGMSEIRRAIVALFVDQSCTFFVDQLAQNSSTFRTTNGGGSGESVSASTYFERDNLFMGDDTKLRVVTGTAPTTWEVTIRLSPDRALAQ